MILKFLSFINLFRLAFLFLLALLLYPIRKNTSVYLFLKLSGPTFIKLGQMLASRSDLIGYSLSKRLEVFQDKLPPFSYKEVIKIIENEFKCDHKEIFLDFPSSPVASASIAQVYKCKTHENEFVAVKVLRPNIEYIIRRDICTLKMVVTSLKLFSKYYANKISSIVEVLDFCSKHELNLLNEASVGAQLKDNLADFEGMYVPKVYFNLTRKRVLTTEWIDGIALSNKEAIANSSIDKIKASENLVLGYFNQVYRDGFFHADMHHGNLFLMNDARIALVDFGIFGVIDKKMRIAVAQILIGFLKKDYLMVAKLHIEAGLVPASTNIHEFALNSRIIGETLIGKSVKNVSFADLLLKLLDMTKKYNMKTHPELLLLQKTIMLVEGVGMTLNKDLNIWDLANPWIKNWAKTNISFDAKIRDYLIDFGQKIKSLPDLWQNHQDEAVKNQELMRKIEDLQKRESGWKFFALIFFSLWLISALSRVSFW